MYLNIFANLCLCYFCLITLSKIKQPLRRYLPIVFAYNLRNMTNYTTYIIQFQVSSQKSPKRPV